MGTITTTFNVKNTNGDTCEIIVRPGYVTEPVTKVRVLKYAVFVNGGFLSNGDATRWFDRAADALRDASSEAMIAAQE